VRLQLCRQPSLLHLLLLLLLLIAAQVVPEVQMAMIGQAAAQLRRSVAALLPAGPACTTQIATKHPSCWLLQVFSSLLCIANMRGC
jgi:hypothetical protein